MADSGPMLGLGHLQRYIWNGRDYLSLKDLWEYVNRYTYLPRLKDRSVLIRTVEAAVGNLLPGPFAYAESYDQATESYRELAIDGARSVRVVIDRDSVIVAPEIAEVKRPASPTSTGGRTGSSDTPTSKPPDNNGAEIPDQPPPEEKMPTRFIGSVMISADRPARDIHQVVEGIVEQLTTLPGSEVVLKLEIDAEIPDGLDRGKVRTLVENANTLGFLEKTVR